MSFMTTNPEELQTAARVLFGIGDRIVTSNTAADKVTNGVVAPGADEVSAKVATHLRKVATNYAGVMSRATEIYDLFLTSLSDAAQQYSTTETINVHKMG
ncbi:PE-PGRS family protein [Mycobacterium haemophilum DSM 44634]|uniref:PE family protein n=1 Tax=Mycobacterium haemophilum TaxID=29311 RepID=UPI0006558D0A|nr:PE family protein [Mycobacterium haemophilum]MCV7342489.1 PE family protein [Mycobacterium haemophilum DSM 44634]